MITLPAGLEKNIRALNNEKNKTTASRRKKTDVPIW